MKRGRELDVVGAQILRERQPVLDRAVGIRVANFARRQLLQRRGQDAHFHELRFENAIGARYGSWVLFDLQACPLDHGRGVRVLFA